MKLKLKVHNRAWREIRAIQNATNMLQVEQAVIDGINKTFGLWDSGMKRIQARKAGAEALEKFVNDQQWRQISRHCWGEKVRAMLLDYTPGALRVSAMYKRFLHGERKEAQS